MTPSQRLQSRMSETRQAANDSTTTDADRDRLLVELSGLETEFRSALAAETAQVDLDFTNHTPLSPEFREQQEITHRADLGVMLGHILARRNVTGAEAEAQEAWNLDGNAIPMSMISELRTVAAPTSGGGTQPVSGYTFPSGIATFANISRPTVPAGTPVYPSIVTGAVAGRPIEGAAHGSSEPTLRGELLTPKRIQAVRKSSPAPEPTAASSQPSWPREGQTITVLTRGCSCHPPTSPLDSRSSPVSKRKPSGQHHPWSCTRWEEASTRAGERYPSVSGCSSRPSWPYPSTIAPRGSR